MAPKKQNSPPAKTNSKSSENNENKKPFISEASTHKKRLPIGKRLFDWFFVLTYIFLFIGICITFIIQCESIVPEKVLDVNIAKTVCQTLKPLEGYLGHLVETNQQWGERIFTAKWTFTLKVIHRTNILFVAPVGLLLAYAFLLGRGWVKNLGLIHATIMLYNVIIINFIAVGAVKADPSNGSFNHYLAFIFYGFLTFFPLVVLKRLWRQEPFTTNEHIRSKSRLKRLGLSSVSLLIWKFKLLCFLWLLAAVISYYEFAVRHTKSMKGMPSVVDHSVKAWDATTPHREALVSGMSTLKDQGLAYSQQAANQVQEMASVVGQQVKEMASGSKKND